MRLDSSVDFDATLAFSPASFPPGFRAKIARTRLDLLSAKMTIPAITTEDRMMITTLAPVEASVLVIAWAVLVLFRPLQSFV